MRSRINYYLKTNRLMINDLYQKTGISPQTFARTFALPVRKWSPGMLATLASVTNVSVEKLYTILNGKPWQLNINSDSQTIQGYRISDPKEFRIDRFIVINECYEGWRPDYRDIQRFIYSYRHPSEQDRKDLAVCTREIESIG